MQDKYVGDVGDYGKFGMLQEIHDQSGGDIRIGINWYYVTEAETGEEKQIDGKYINYLNEKTKDSEKFRICFPDLFEKLKPLVKPKNRLLENAEKAGILPHSTIFFSTILPTGDSPADRLIARDRWFRDSLAILKDADIIFVDPDNGLYLDSSMKKGKKGVKYVFPDEVDSYFKMGKTVIIYHHKDRIAREKYDQKISSVRKFVGNKRDVRFLKFKRFSVRHYIFMIQPEHRDIIDRAFNQLTTYPCDFLFEEYFTSFKSICFLSHSCQTRKGHYSQRE